MDRWWLQVTWIGFVQKLFVVSSQEKRIKINLKSKAMSTKTKFWFGLSAPTKKSFAKFERIWVDIFGGRHHLLEVKAIFCWLSEPKTLNIVYDDQNLTDDAYKSGGWWILLSQKSQFSFFCGFWILKIVKNAKNSRILWKKILIFDHRKSWKFLGNSGQFFANCWKFFAKNRKFLKILCKKYKLEKCP